MELFFCKKTLSKYGKSVYFSIFKKSELPIFHYENLPMQKYRDFVSCKKMKIFSRIFFDIFLIFAQNIDCGYTLEPPRRGGSNEYPQSMFWSKNKKNRYTPAYPSFAIEKWGSRGYTLHGHVFLMRSLLLNNKDNVS